MTMFYMDTTRSISFISLLHRTLLFAIMIVLELTVLVQANPGTELPSRDNGFYLYIGDQIVHDKLPYRDGWESKPPAIFYVNATGLWIGRGSRWGIWVIEFGALLTAIVVSFFLEKRLWGTWPALLGMLLWLYAFDRALVGGNLTEEYPIPLHFISIFLFLELLKKPKQKLFNFMLGLAVGISFLFRPNNAIIETAIILTLGIIRIFQREIRSLLSHTLWIGLGLLTPLLITGIYFWMQGLFQDLLEASLLYNLTYSQEQLTPISPLGKGFSLFGPVAWIALAGYITALIQIVRHPRGQLAPVYLFLLIAFPMTIYLSDPARRTYEHYYLNWIPILGLLSGLAIHALVSPLSARVKFSFLWNTAGLMLVLLLSTTFFFSSGRAGQYQKAIGRLRNYQGANIEKRSPISIYVENHTEPGELVLFWGAYPGENYMSNRASPTSVLFYPLMVKSNISERLNQRFLRELVKNQPILIVDMDYGQALSLDPEKRLAQQQADTGWSYPPDNLNEVFAYIQSHYLRDAVIDGKTVYRLQKAE